MQTLELLARFVADIIYSVIGFVIVGLAAWAVGLFVGWLESQSIIRIFVDTMKYLEYFIFGVDVIGFLFLVFMSLIKFLREVWRIYK